MGIELNNDQIMANYALENWWNSGTKKQTFEISGGAGVGKALANDTKIPTPDGYKLIKDIVVGDYVFDHRGKPTKVLGVYPQGKKKCFNVKLLDGRSVVCSSDHLFSIVEIKDDKLNLNNMTVKEIKKTLDSGEKQMIPLLNNLEVEYNSKITVDMTSPMNIGREISAVNLMNIKMNYYDKNFYRLIPDEYLYGNSDERYDLLRGIFENGTDVSEAAEIKEIPFFSDSKGVKVYIEIGCKELLDQLIQLMHSLGLHRFLYKFADNVWKLYCLIINDDYLSYIACIEDMHKYTEMTCLYVDSSEHLFLCEDFIVTHNTTLIMYFIDRIGLPLNNVLFTSFTGKAVNVMQRHGLPARTIHSSIYDYVQVVDRDENGEPIRYKNGKIKLKGVFELKDHLPKKIKLIVIDEASMVPEQLAHDILSFGLPVVALGDLNQLPPVMGNPYFLKNPDVILTQIMRQAEGNPIIWLAQQVLSRRPLKRGVYGSSSVITKKDLTDYQFIDADIVLTCLNKTKYDINQYFRENLKQIKQLDYPHLNEKVMCCKNNWNEIVDGFYLTNGMMGFVDHTYKESYDKRSISIDFRPDFLKKIYRKLDLDYKYLYDNPSLNDTTNLSKYTFGLNKFEYSYACTVHKYQGSQADKVLFIYEDFMNSDENNRKLLYTGITRAVQQIQIVLP